MKDVFYECDPDKNKRCRKTSCFKYGKMGKYNDCRMTDEPEYAVLDENGKPIVAYVRGENDGTV